MTWGHPETTAEFGRGGSRGPGRAPARAGTQLTAGAGAAPTVLPRTHMERCFGEPLLSQPCHRPLGPAWAAAEPSEWTLMWACAIHPPRVTAQDPAAVLWCLPTSCNAAGTPRNICQQLACSGAVPNPTHVERLAVMDRPLPARVGSTSLLCWAAQSTANHSENCPR